MDALRSKAWAQQQEHTHFRPLINCPLVLFVFVHPTCDGSKTLHNSIYRSLRLEITPQPLQQFVNDTSDCRFYLAPTRKVRGFSEHHIRVNSTSCRPLIYTIQERSRVEECPKMRRRTSKQLHLRPSAT